MNGLPTSDQLDDAEQRLHRALLLERHGPLRPELPEHERAAKRKADARFWRELEELQAVRDAAAVLPFPAAERSA